MSAFEEKDILDKIAKRKSTVFSTDMGLGVKFPKMMQQSHPVMSKVKQLQLSTNTILIL